MKWSRRLPPDLAPSSLAKRLDALPPGIDLTLSNPTQAELPYEHQALRRALMVDVQSYTPSPLGDPVARTAVAHYAGTSPERVVITASTSEAYAMAMKLVCDSGDAVAVPTPSYPLVPHLSELEGLEAVRYELRFDTRWRIDFASLERALLVGARLVVVVSPNNPTGHIVTPYEAETLFALCARYGAALVVDEVFAPYGTSGKLPTLGTDHGPLMFVLDGLSKAVGLPQLKLGWMILYGQKPLVDAALPRLEWIADAYLSAATPVQRAAPALLNSAPPFQEAVRARLRHNRDALARALPDANWLLPYDGGWYALVRLPRDVDEEALVLTLADRYGVRVQPGFLYDFPEPRYLVISLLIAPEPFIRGAEKLVSALKALCV